MSSTDQTKTSYPRGSEWRKWDLHFHTPSSYDYQHKGATNAQIVQTMVDANVGAFAVTDHHIIDVQRIRELQVLAAGRVTIFPGIELRTDLGGSSMIHMIGIFPEYCDLEDVWTKVAAKFCITAADVNRKGDDKVWVDFRDSAEFIHELGGVVTVHAGRKANSVEEISNSALYKQQIKTELLSESVDVLEVGRTADLADYEKKVFPAIGFSLPLCIFSDCHDIREYSVPALCWIKADPTFHGLQQIINEPTDRVYVGEVPPAVSKIATKATRIVSTVELRKVQGSSMPEKWFDCSLPLNTELVVVIGNKGSGKSALADVLGLLGNSPRHEMFSFLSPERFRSERNNKSVHFSATLTWADNKANSVPSLHYNPEQGAVEKVKYIPQNYLEKICNEIELGKQGPFYRELEQVIFSHVALVDKLHCETLDELLTYRTEETSEAIKQLVGEMQTWNARIVATEEQASPQHEAALKAQLAEKERELTAHLLTRPVEVVKPDADSSIQQQARTVEDALANKQNRLKTLEMAVDAAKVEDAAAAKKKSVAEKLAGKIANLKHEYEKFALDTENDFQTLGLERLEVISIKFDTAQLESATATIDAQRATITAKLDPFKEDSLIFKQRQINSEITGLQQQLGAAQKAYQVYLQRLEEWKQNEAAIIGSEDAIGSITYLKKLQDDLTGLPTRLRSLRRQRELKLVEIYQEKRKLRAHYSTYYGAVQKFLGEHELAANEHFRLTFNVSMVQSGFSDTFFCHINQRRIGPFMGTEEGATVMKKLLERANFDTRAGALRFTRDLFEVMTKHEGRTLFIKDQLRQNSTLQELYDYVFSLEYLSPIYNLQWGGKTLEQLSPGERGNLLLIFYLLVDQDDIPLVIDQPEENLDNQTVFRTLVPCIKHAKKRRQIVMVTHNPNLAVVCDAEQIICATMQKDQGHEVTYLSGSIEDPVINQRIVDVLEGTRPAFDKRDDKYIQLEK